ncbi:hypothetical protein [Rhodanobacter sp. A1T4]|uniref:hypothetical protein n=1 Tax=Rhodanobacter sp. A1T4 TaxID=2723087 RepID=UPI0016079D32|nr:hypothetical protein [Rhodanobacter sp. A1T4]MBB6247202.1 hypothetical protein [Rhodanobacter sp. A1T4]
MSHVFLLPTSVVVPLALSVVLAVSARSRHKHLVDKDIYCLPLPLAYLMAVIGVGFLGVPFIPGVEGSAAPLWFDAFFASFSTAAVVASIFFMRYRVILGAKSLDVRFLLNERVIPLTDIIDTNVLEGRARELIVYLRGGRRLKLSGLLQDFDDLVARIQDTQVSRTESAEKLADQQRAAVESQGAIWIICIGLALVGVAAIASWIVQRH